MPHLLADLSTKGRYECVSLVAGRMHTVQERLLASFSRQFARDSATAE